MVKTNKGFTLVELLAVIVILAIILVIAVPKVMSVIEDSKKATLESTAKMIASAAEKQKVQNTVLGKETTITCDSVAKINKLDYDTCDIDFADNTAKVTIKGKGKFTGLNVCSGTKTNAIATDEECSAPGGNTLNFETDSWATIVAAVQKAYENGIEYPYNVGDEKTIDLGTTLGTHTIRVANKTKCSDDWMEDVTKSQTACGFVLEFKDIIENIWMQYSESNLRGWPGSFMHDYLNSYEPIELDPSDGDEYVETIYSVLPEELRNEIIDTYVLSSHGEFDEGTIGENKEFESTDKLYLLSPQEIYGTSSGTSRQLDYYATYKGEGYMGVSSDNCEGAIKNNSSGSANYWWLRSATSAYGYYAVNVSGCAYTDYANAYSGVSPAFRLAN